MLFPRHCSSLLFNFHNKIGDGLADGHSIGHLVDRGRLRVKCERVIFIFDLLLFVIIAVAALSKMIILSYHYHHHQRQRGRCLTRARKKYKNEISLRSTEYRISLAKLTSWFSVYCDGALTTANDCSNGTQKRDMETTVKGNKTVLRVTEAEAREHSIHFHLSASLSWP